MNKTVTINIYFSEPKSVKTNINKYKNLDYMIFGKNTNDEDMDISFSEDGVVTKTYQNNGWLRVNYYDKNGFMECETFEGKWR